MANMKLIEAKTVNPAVSSVVFSAIPQTYTDLKLVCSVRSNDSGVDSVRIRPNGSTSNMHTRWIQGDLTGTSGSVYSENYPFALVRCNGNNVTSTFGSGEFYIANYASTTLNKALWTFSTSESGGERVLQNMSAALWSDTTAISSITLVTESGQNFLTNSTFYLYGIESSAITGTKATGGVIYQDTNYFYHVFGTSGTFTPTQNLTADVLVVAGGGSGGAQSTGGGNGGGGGAGGFLTFTSQSLTTSAYTVTVGAGGALPSNNAQGNDGSNSQFGSLTAAVGGGGGGTYGDANDPDQQGRSGGSGGGVGQSHGGSYTGGTGTSGQGNAGGSSYGGGDYAGGGGGGAGAAGGNSGPAYAPGVGGVGLSTAISGGETTGTGQLVSGTYYFAGGGGGGPDGNGGSGGGGKGASTATGGNGLVNTGGGGGGGEYSLTSKLAGTGGSGIVIVRYTK